jgi:hypothetical protein
MDVRVCGPNLRDQSRGAFHVHEASCRDLRLYGSGKRNGGDREDTLEMLVEEATVSKIVYATYADQIAERINDEQQSEEEAVDDLAGNFYFAPCCAELLKTSWSGNEVKDLERQQSPGSRTETKWGTRYIVVAVGTHDVPCEEADARVALYIVKASQPFTATLLSPETSDKLTVTLLQERGAL